jgi:hypothetical protein
MNNRNFNTELITRRAVLVEQYARFKRCAAILMKRGSVRFDKERHTYFIRVGDYFRGTGRDYVAAKKLMELQSLIKEQSVRLLELEDIIE